jgi:hypothetical protein
MKNFFFSVGINKSSGMCGSGAGWSVDVLRSCRAHCFVK